MRVFVGMAEAQYTIVIRFDISQGLRRAATKDIVEKRITVNTCHIFMIRGAEMIP